MENLEGGSFACVTVVNGVCGAIIAAIRLLVAPADVALACID